MDDGVGLLVTEHRTAAPLLRLPVVFLPGWVSHRSGWNDLVGRLARSAAVFYVESRDKESADLGLTGSPDGRGRPRNPDMGVGRQARDLAAVVRALGLGERGFFLVGSSTGSNVILEYLAGEAAPRPAAAALMIPVRRFPIPGWAQPLLWLPHPLISALKPAIKAYISAALSDRSGERTMLRYNYDSIDRLEPRRTRLAARALLDYELPADLSRVAQPILVAAASADRMHRSDVAEEIASQVASCERIDVGESGRVHSAWMAEQLIAFLSRHQQA